MDLLCRRYANPFFLLNGYLQSGRFFEFVQELTEIGAHEKLWEFYLHKVDGRSYREFEASLLAEQPTAAAEAAQIVQESRAILDAFRPEERR